MDKGPHHKNPKDQAEKENSQNFQSNTQQTIVKRQEKSSQNFQASIEPKDSRRGPNMGTLPRLSSESLGICGGEEVTEQFWGSILSLQ